MVELDEGVMLKSAYDGCLYFSHEGEYIRIK